MATVKEVESEKDRLEKENSLLKMEIASLASERPLEKENSLLKTERCVDTSNSSNDGSDSPLFHDRPQQQRSSGLGKAQNGSSWKINPAKHFGR